MEFRIIAFGTPDFDQSLELRRLVLRVPLNLEFSAKEIESEYSSTHMGCFDSSGHIIGVLVMIERTADIVKMRQVAVQNELQGMGIGRKLVRYSEAWAKKNGYQWIELHARIQAVPFYDRLKYSRVGKPFIEVGIKHYKMKKQLK
jgi:predicted GNAT family N-acyltransferase